MRAYHFPPWSRTKIRNHLRGVKGHRKNDISKNAVLICFNMMVLGWWILAIIDTDFSCVRNHWKVCFLWGYDPPYLVSYRSIVRSISNDSIDLKLNDLQLQRQSVNMEFLPTIHNYNEKKETPQSQKNTHEKHQPNLHFSGWWFQAIWKICSSNWIISPGIGMKIIKCLKPPPSSPWRNPQIRIRIASLSPSAFGPL